MSKKATELNVPLMDKLADEEYKIMKNVMDPYVFDYIVDCRQENSYKTQKKNKFSWSVLYTKKT